MNAVQIGRLFRRLGFAVNLLGLVLLLWNFYELHEQRLQRSSYYYNTKHDEGMIVAGYLRTLVCVAAGCVLLWIGSELGRRRIKGPS